MKLIFKEKLATILVVMLSLLLLIPNAFAQEEICAAIYPCLENGEILPEFNQPGFCGDNYRLICAKTKTSLMSDDLLACEKESSSYQAKSEKLNKKIRKLRLKLRSKK